MSILIFIIVLSVLIIVHEFGHFIVAKSLGVHVERFALGFGPKLFSYTYQGTEFLVCAIPLGGYVKMAGDERHQCKGLSDEYYSKSPGHRSLIVLMGPVVNYVLAYVCLVFVFLLGFPDMPAKVGELIQGGPAQQAGLQPGDQIMAVNSQPIYGWGELESGVAGSRGAQIELTILRNEQKITKTINPRIERQENIFGQEEDVRMIGISPYANIIGDVPAGPAKKAGLKKGDQILEIDQQNILGWTDLQEKIANAQNDRMELKIMRDGELMTKTVVPKIIKRKDPSGEEQEVRQIGVSPQQQLEAYRFGLGESFGRASQKLFEITTLTYEALFRITTGAMSPKDAVTGPIGIFYIIKEAAAIGFSYLLYIVGVVSASLAIFNLLPLPVLDGGHLLFLGIEKLRGRALPEKVEETIMRVGVSCLIFLALFVFYCDFVRFGWIDKMMNLWN